MSLKEYDVVKLRRAVPEHSLDAGAVGAIVMVYDSDPREYEVEFCEEAGTTLALLTLREEDVELVKAV